MLTYVKYAPLSPSASSFKIAIALQLLLRWGDAPLLPPTTSLKIATLKSHYTVEGGAVVVFWILNKKIVKQALRLRHCEELKRRGNLSLGVV